MANFINELKLSNYRNFKKFSYDCLSPIQLISGDNGVGKTNILEAISFLSPGKGLRNVKVTEIGMHTTMAWQAEFKLTSKIGLAELAISYDALKNKKSLHFNAAPIPQSELPNFTIILWLTPQMDGLFLGPSSDRRKFLDRIVYATHINHATLLNRYEYYQKERLQLLTSSSYDLKWLAILEQKLAELAILITTNRLETIHSLNQTITTINSAFPKAHIDFLEPISNSLDNIEELVRQFYNNRNLDQYSKRTNFGPHKADINCSYLPDNIAAKNCSTGQQKALMISILMAQALAAKEHTGTPPILLLDEIFTHLDSIRRASLAEFLQTSGSQCFITSTEETMIDILPNGQMLKL